MLGVRFRRACGLPYLRLARLSDRCKGHPQGSRSHQRSTPWIATPWSRRPAAADDSHHFHERANRHDLVPVLRIRPPCTGAKNPKIGKRGFQSQKTPFPSTPEKGASSQKSPQGKWGFFDSKRPFLGWREMGVFRLRNPLFPILGFLAPVQGGRIRNASQETPRGPELSSEKSLCLGERLRGNRNRGNGPERF